MKKISNIHLLVYLSILSSSANATDVNPEEPFKNVAREYVIQCNVHAMRNKKISGFDKSIFKLFSQKISDSNDKAGTCENLINALDHTELENKSAIKGAIKEGALVCYNYAVSWLPQNMCEKDPNFLVSCHNKCKEILNDACGTHADREK